MTKSQVAVHPRAQLYVAPSPHNGWVAIDLDDPSKLWLFTLYKDSWERKQPYDGTIDGLQKRHASEAWNTGWPGARPSSEPDDGPANASTAPAPKLRGRRVLPASQARACQMATKVTIAEQERIAAAAEANGVTVSDFIRGAALAAATTTLGDAPRLDVVTGDSFDRE